MPTFRAELVDRAGVARTEELEAADRAEALAALGAERRHALRRLAEVEPAGAPGGASLLTDVAATAEGLGRLLGRGLPLAPALREVARGARSDAAAAELERAAAAAEDGTSLAEALAREPGGVLGSPLALGLVRVGERSGRLPALLRDLGRLTGRIEAVRRTAVVGCTYPLALVGFAILLAAAVLTAAGPAAETYLRLRVSAGEEAPLLFRTAAAVGASSPALLWAGAAAAVAGLVGLRAALSRGLVRAATRGGRGALGRPVRDAALLGSLAALVEHDVPPAAAWEVVRAGLAPGAAPDADRAVAEGETPFAVLAGAGVLDAAERSALEAAARSGAADVAAELRAVAGRRAARFERRVEAWGRRLGLALELAVGAALLVVALQLAPSAYRMGW